MLGDEIDVLAKTHDTCVDCGAAISLCEHAAQRMMDPERGFWQARLAEVQADLAESEQVRRQAEAYATKSSEDTAPLRLRIGQMLSFIEQAGKEFGNLSDCRHPGINTECPDGSLYCTLSDRAFTFDASPDDGELWDSVVEMADAIRGIVDLNAVLWPDGLAALELFRRAAGLESGR